MFNGNIVKGVHYYNMKCENIEKCLWFRAE